MTATIEKPEADVVEAWQGKWRNLYLHVSGQYYGEDLHDTEAEAWAGIELSFAERDKTNATHGEANGIYSTWSDFITAFPIPVRGDE